MKNKIKQSNIELPSNKKFGFFFAFIFFISAAYFFLNDIIVTAYIFFALAITFLTITFVNEDALLSLNKLWMRLGQLLGMIISPIILGVIFFGLFTPCSLVMRLFRRDELQLKFKKKESHWKARKQLIPQTNFTQQF